MTGTIERERLNMVACEKCQANNSLDSKFCRKCGHALPESDLAVASAKLEELVAEGYKVLGDGHTAEAMMIANSALTTNPVHAKALGLKGMCHEREGQVAEALECFEQVLAQNPDSALDRIKVNQLRNRLAANLAVEPEPPNRRVALVGAAAAVLLVMAVSALLSTIQRPGAQAATAQLDTGSVVEPIRVNQPETPPAATGQQQPNQPENQGSALSTPQFPPVNPQGQLPAATGGAGVIDLGGNEPVRPPIIGDIGLRPDGSQAGANTAPPSPPTFPPVDRRDPDPDEMKANEPPKENTGIVDIRISSAPPRASGGSEPVGGNSLEALVQTARTQMMAGKYADAARTFERALKSGGEPGSINQRLGQCYEKLGQNTQAVAAYQRAISAYEAAARSGAGGERVNAALEATRQALKVLQSGA